MTSKEIRQKYLDFFKQKGHAILPSASLLPENDPTTLFTGSGMQPMVPYLLGEKHPEGTRLADSQKCFRTEDIEEVGDSRHNTFFEMLGNWSLGDYFKKEQLTWLFEFLTKEIGIDADKLYVSVFRGNKTIGIEKDQEAVDIWKKLFKEAGIEARDVDFSEEKGLRDGRIFYYGEEKNWWSRSGAPANMPAGEPGGPDSEVFYDTGKGAHEVSKFKDRPCHINCDCGRFIEIGNSVFMAYQKTDQGFIELEQKNIDFGGGLERIVMAAQGKNNIFQTDLFSGLIARIEELSGKKYQSGEDLKNFEIIADHIKASVFMIGDDKGVAPSNVDQGYFIRRLIRRAVRRARQIRIASLGWTREIAEIIIDDYKDVYEELARNRTRILDELEKEEKKFSKTLEKGLKEFDITANRLKKTDNRVISGKEVFNLFATYGFPVEMTMELAQEKGLKVDKEGFEKEMKKHQELSKTASAGKFKGGLADASKETTALHTTAHLTLAALRRVLGEHVEQKGSNITAERLRFDFSHGEKMTDEEKREVERLVNEAIEADAQVSFEELGVQEAKASGAVGVFESRYGAKVKVYTVRKGDKVYSREICGGPHVERTGELGKFRIKKEQSSQAGVRRIKAVLE